MILGHKLYSAHSTLTQTLTTTRFLLWLQTWWSILCI